MNYLIVVAGYEGIEKIIGLFDKGTAIKKMTELRGQPLDKWTKPEQYCVQYVDENGACCCCSELGFPLKETWFM